MMQSEDANGKGSSRLRTCANCQGDMMLAQSPVELSTETSAFYYWECLNCSTKEPIGIIEKLVALSIIGLQVDEIMEKKNL